MITRKSSLPGYDGYEQQTCSRKDAAQYLGVSARTFDRIQKTKAIAFVMVGQRRRYLQADLDHYLQANRSI